MGARVAAAALALALALPALPARADTPGPAAQAPSQPVIDPAYNPAAHGELSYAAYMLMSRGTRRRSTGMMVAGIIISSLGAVAMGAGTGIYFSRAGCDDLSPRFPGGIEGDFGSPNECNRGATRTAGMAIVIAGAIGAALGVPLWILGASDVPWAEAAGQNERAPAKPSWARLVPMIQPTQRGVGLAIHF